MGAAQVAGIRNLVNAEIFVQMPIKIGKNLRDLRVRSGSSREKASGSFGQRIQQKKELQENAGLIQRSSLNGKGILPGDIVPYGTR